MKSINIVSIFPAVIVFFILSLSPGEAIPQSQFQVNSKFPTIRLPSLNNHKPMSIEDFHGHKVIIHIFASW